MCEPNNPQLCAIASRIKTPGMIGKSGKCPLKKSSSGETNLFATIFSLDTSITSSINKKGSLCGKKASTFIYSTSQLI